MLKDFAGGAFQGALQGAIGMGARSLMGAADAATGGLASQLTNKIIHSADSNAGMIGKVASGLGKSMLNDKFRNKLSSVADKALQYIPEGSVKTALTKINNEAQGRSGPYAPSNSSPSPLMKPYGGFRNTREARVHNWNNPSHETKTSYLGN